MDFDPANRDVPTPRYELESGSEDEFEPETSTRATKEPLRLVATDGSDAAGALSNTKLVVLVGGAGSAWLASLDGRAPAQQVALQSGTEQIAGIAVVDSAAGEKLSVALVAPPAQMHSSRFHDIAHSLLDAARPSSVVIVDSYSPQESVHRSSSEYADHDESDPPLKYLATPRFLEANKVDTRRMVALRAPEAASRLGAAFLSEAVVRDTPAMLALLEDVSFQSHVQLYGSLGSARVSTATSQALTGLTGLSVAKTELRGPEVRGPSIVDFATSRRTKPANNLALLGDGNMYI